jgi:hypothetical protein
MITGCAALSIAMILLNNITINITFISTTNITTNITT